MPTFWINLSQGMPAALLCKTPLLCTSNITEIVNKYWPLKHQPGCSAGILHVTQRGNTSSKARVSGTILLEKNQNKNPALKQTVHFKPLFLLLFVFNCTRNDLFWTTILKDLEKFCQVLEKHNVILKLQSDKLLLWENNHLLNDWAGGLNHCFTQVEKGLQEHIVITAPTPGRPQTSTISEHHHIGNENLKELLCTIFAWPEFGHCPENIRMVPQHVCLCLFTKSDWYHTVPSKNN